MLKILKNKYLWLLLLVLSVTFVMLRLTGTERDSVTVLEATIRDGYAPLQGGLTGFKTQCADFTSGLSSKRVLLQQIQTLQDQNDVLRRQNQALYEYRAEAMRLQKLITFRNVNLETYDLIPARVIARSPSTWYKFIIIDRGTAEGIRRNMAVISPAGLVGRVASTGQHTAQVNLLTDREMAVGVISQDSRDTRGIVEGMGDDNLLRMANIPYYSEIRVGEKAVTSGLSQIYPPGVLIGTIEAINDEAGGLLKSAVVKPAVHFDQLEEVYLISSYKATPAAGE